MLIIENQAGTEIEIGKIGRIAFKRGFYAYVGSALSGLERRTERHLREVGNNKRVHWHIDYFLVNPAVKVREVICAETDERKECEIAANMSMRLESIARFGCTDCSCKSHLFFSTSLTALKEQVYGGFHSAGEHFLATKINPV